VILVPKGQFPWRENAITASPGQHLQLNIRFDKLNRYSKPPTQECRPPAGPTVYRIPSWRTSWNYSSPEFSPMSENLTFEMQDQRDCVNLYAVKKFIEHCGCLPSFLPLFQNYTYCFNQTDMESIKRMEKCYTERMSSISRYEMEARQVCLTMCNTRFYTFRPITYPWPGLTIETAVDFMQNSQGDWSYPYNFLFSKGIANLFYLDIRSSEMYNRSTMLSASELLDFRNKLEVLQESLVKVSIKPVSDFGQEMTEEPSYTIKNLLADLGGALGLWSGISVLTACELIELLVYLVAATRRTEQPAQPSGPATGNAEQQDSGEMKADDSATEVEMTDKMTDIAAPEVSISVH
uniref:Amiloride-sensitive sodium channel subunit gamma n=1 Tax=Macrostomum lignano TaxID=282301 RepID=A0A1I8I066_9PLAT